MFFRNAAVGAVALLAGLAFADDCESGPWNPASITVSGTQSQGHRFCATNWKNGGVIVGVETWEDSTLRGIKFKYSEGPDSVIYGKFTADTDTSMTHKTLDWKATDQIQEFESYYESNGKTVGGVRIKVAGNEFKAGSSKGGKLHKLDGGVLLGAYGTCGTKVDSLGLLFLKSKIAQMTATDFKFVSYGSKITWREGDKLIKRNNSLKPLRSSTRPWTPRT